MPGSEKREPIGEESAAKQHEHHKTASQEHASDPEHSEGGAQNEAAEEGITKKKDKYDRSGPHPIKGLIIFAAFQFLSLLFIVIATPIEMFTINDAWRDRIYPALAGTRERLCVTAWGMKRGCRSTGYYNRDFSTSFCYRVRTDFKLVEAFCLMTIAFMTFAFFLAICSIFQKVGKGSTASVAAFAMVIGTIPWGIIAGMYWQRPCCDTIDWHKPSQATICRFSVNSAIPTVDAPAFREMGAYGAGFGLLVASWCLQVIGTVFAFVPF